MTRFTDQMGRTISLEAVPKRIISLVPSQTELLYTLGLEEEVVGITKFCVHPESWFRSKTRVGGTKNYKPELIHSLQPDLIIGNKEENEQSGIEALMEAYPVWMSDIRNLDDSLEMMRGIGLLCGKEAEAASLIALIQSGFSGLERQLPRKVLYFIWYKPWMAAGKDTFISHILEKAGWTNVLPENSRYPQLSEEEIAASGAELVLLSSEPFPFAEKHMELIRNILPHADIRLVDGEMFSWYGSRLLHTPQYINNLLKG